MLNYLNINNIMAFPISSDLSLPNGSMKHDFRALSEPNITNILTSFVDRKSFVISCDKKMTAYRLDEVDIKFFIEGHYFRATLTSEYLSEVVNSHNTTLYATILMGNAPTYTSDVPQSDAEEYQYMIVGVNTTTEGIDYFTGVHFTTSNEIISDDAINPNGRVIVPMGYYSKDEENNYTYYVSSHSLLLLTYDTESESWSVPDDSKVKFETKSFGDIDGGLVE